MPVRLNEEVDDGKVEDGKDVEDDEDEAEEEEVANNENVEVGEDEVDDETKEDELVVVDISEEVDVDTKVLGLVAMVVRDSRIVPTSTMLSLCSKALCAAATAAYTGSVKTSPSPLLVVVDKLQEQKRSALASPEEPQASDLALALIALSGSESEMKSVISQASRITGRLLGHIWLGRAGGDI